MSSLNKKNTLERHPPIGDRINQLLDTTGDGTGTTEQAADFSAVPGEFIYKPAVGTAAVIYDINIGIEDGSAFAANLYGGVAALTNGIKVTVKDASGGVIHDFTPNPIKKTWHWGLVADANLTPIAFAVGVDRVNIHWNLENAGDTLVLDGDKGQYLSVLIRDDLSGLVSQLMQIQGYLAR